MARRTGIVVQFRFSVHLLFCWRQAEASGARAYHQRRRSGSSADPKAAKNCTTTGAKIVGLRDKMDVQCLPFLKVKKEILECESLLRWATEEA
jgi:hypothetical protein